MATLYVDDKKFEVEEGKNVLETCLSLGFDLPYFCWHPAMGSVGACRQCAVKQFKDKDDDKGKIIMACMQPVEDETFISIEDSEARDFRKGVVELLMTNHPHDCPTCDEGGECHLQDMTVMTGHNYRNYRFKKRTYRNQNLGPCINHEMNRCIQCYRCVRFYKDYAGGDDLDVFSTANEVYFGRKEEGTLKSEFSGNLVEVCPTGVFTDKTLKKHYTRKWDMTSAPSVCQQCSVGCNTIVSERYDQLRRVMSRYNGQVNGYFICDRGRFGYDFVNDPDRIRSVQTPEGKSTESFEETLRELASHIREKGAIGIGSPVASVESNFALRELVGEEHFYHGIPDTEKNVNDKILGILKQGPVSTPSLKEMESADAILVLGEDVTHAAPMMALALRQAVRSKTKEMGTEKGIPSWNDYAVQNLGQESRWPMVIASLKPGRLDGVASQVLHTDADGIAAFGFAVSHFLNASIDLPENISDEHKRIAVETAEILKKAEKPLVVSGSGLMNEKIVEAAANVAWSLVGEERDPQLSYILRESNSLGLAMMSGKPLKKALESSGAVVISLEDDLYRIATAQQVEKLVDQAHLTVALHHTPNKTTAASDCVLPVTTFAESEGTTVNHEGRAQRFFSALQTQGQEVEAWKILDVLQQLTAQRETIEGRNLDEYLEEIAQKFPQFAGIEKAAPFSNFRRTGQKIPRQSHRYSGRTAMHAHNHIHEQQPPQDDDSPFAFSMEGYDGQPPSAAIPFFWSPGWNSQQAINKYQIEVGGELHGGDPGVRLIEPENESEPKWFGYSSIISRPEEGKFLVLPYYHIFGSESTSIKSPALQERSPGPRLLVPKSLIESGAFKNGEKVTLDGVDLKLELLGVAGLPEHVVAYPQGMPEMPFVETPLHTKITKI